MKIIVTREDIKRGCHCDPDCCPVGRALSRAGVTHLGVLGARVVIEDGPQHAHFLTLPSVVRNWILSFDRYDRVSPITFNLPVPVRHGNGRGGRRRHQNHQPQRALSA